MLLVLLLVVVVVLLRGGRVGPRPRVRQEDRRVFEMAAEPVWGLPEMVPEKLSERLRVGQAEG